MFLTVTVSNEVWGFYYTNAVCGNKMTIDAENYLYQTNAILCRLAKSITIK